METRAAFAETLEERLATLAPQAATFEKNPNSTIEPPALPVDAAASRALRVLEALGRTQSEALEFERTLGQGGMGIVHLGTQVALGRKVAIKTLKPESRNPVTTMRLLREAWVTGALEHPNVVPVYDVGVDATGSPVIVLKRIEGVHWGTLVGDVAEIERRFGAEDALEWNLRILMQVANAVHFAHSRGILHRDLKPENVMIGEFGEVYVLDWGLALSLRDAGDGRLPLAKDARGVAGTPAYMAPEMLADPLADLSERTDVYLLGAILHEIATGRPPHGGDNMMAIVSSVLISEPKLEGDVEPELAAICRRAMSREPGDRFPSAADLHAALSRFLEHRGSLRLAAEAERRLAKLEARLASPESHDGYRLEVYNLFGECRFGFRGALAEWDENQAAKDGVVRATAAMADYELGQGDPRAAAALLAEISGAPEELASRVSAALAAKATDDKKRAELEQIGRNLDPEIGSRTRTFVVVVLGLFWTLSPLLGNHVAAMHAPTHAGAMIATLVILLVSSSLVFWARDSLGKSLINRRVVATVLFTLLAQALLHLGAVVVGISPEPTFILHFFLWFTVASLMSIHLEPRLFPSAIAYFAAFIAAGMLPAHVYRMMSGANFVLTLNIALVWGRALEPRAPAKG